jgi:hypothetical protein
MRAAGANVGYEALHLIILEAGRPHSDDAAVAAQDDELPLLHCGGF